MGGVRCYYNTSGLILLVPDVFRSGYCDRRRKARMYTHDLSADLHESLLLLLFLFYILSLQCIILYKPRIPVDPSSGKITSTVVNLVARRGVWYSVYIWDYIIYRAIRHICLPLFYRLVIPKISALEFWLLGNVITNIVLISFGFSYTRIFRAI